MAVRCEVTFVCVSEIQANLVVMPWVKYEQGSAPTDAWLDDDGTTITDELNEVLEIV